MPVLIRIAALVIAGLALSSCNDPYPPHDIYIKGVVTDSITGNPISGATIEVSSNGKVPDSGGITDAEGKYSVYNIGTVIVATKRGYQAYYAALDNISRNSTVTYNIELTPGSTGDTTPPAAPLTYFVFPANDTIYWSSSNPSDVAGYTIYRSDTAMSSTYFTGFSDFSTIAGSPYCYSIAAYDASGNESSRSGEMCFTALSNTSSPGPYFIGVTVLSPSEIKINWGTDKQAPFNIYRDGLLVKSLTAGEGASPDDWHKISYSDSGLSPGVKYCYTITEVTVGGETQPTPQTCITTWPNL
jgi:hypothetical protein